MNKRIIIIVAVLLCLMDCKVFAGNGGNIFQAPKSELQHNREDAARRLKAAQKKTEELNKKWKAHLRKEARAMAKAKARAKKRRRKIKKNNELKESPPFIKLTVTGTN